CLTRCRGGLYDGTARRVRRHPVKHPGTPVPECLPHLRDLVGRPIERAAHHQEDPFGTVPPCLLCDPLRRRLAQRDRLHLAKFDASGLPHHTPPVLAPTEISYERR